MEIIVKENRELIIKNPESTQNENDVQIINLTVPEKYESFDKKIAFVTEEGVFWGLIENNTYKLERNITKYDNVDFYIWLTKEDEDFRSVEANLPFYKNHKVEGEVTPEEQSQMEQVISILESEVDKVENINISAQKEGNTATVSITDKDGNTTSVEILDGERGEDGTNGVDGVSPTIATTQITGGYNLEITDATGTNTITLLNGQDGTDGRDGRDRNKSELMVEMGKMELMELELVLLCSILTTQ